MATNTEAAGETAQSENTLPEADAAKFEGFATKDGDRIAASADAGKGAGQGFTTQARRAASTDQGGKAAAEGDDDEAGADDKAGGTDQERHKSAQVRISKAVGRQRAAERERDEYRDKSAALEARLAALEARADAPASGGKQGNGKAPHDPAAPRAEDYEHGELNADYIRDLARYETRKELQDHEQKRTAKQQTADQKAAEAAHKVRVDALKNRGYDAGYEDFDDVVLNNDIQISPVLGEMLLDSEYGHTIAYELASDPKEAKKVAAMTPGRQAAWFGKREAELSSDDPDADDATPANGAAARASHKTTQAPAPLRGKSRGNGATQPASASTTDFAAFERMAMHQQK
jgi:hypothetical protein